MPPSPYATKVPGNRLLAALPEAARSRLHCGLRRAPVPRRQSLHEPGQPIQHVHFPLTAVISLVTVLRDRVQGDTFLLTQQFLSQMLGVTRPSVTITARTLQQAGLIRYRRGEITMLDRAGLEEAACECYQATRETYTRDL